MTVFHRLGRFCARRRYLVVSAWAALLLVSLPFAPQAPGALQAGGFSAPWLEAARARQTLEAELGLPPSAMVILLESLTDARAGDPAFESAVAEALGGLRHAEHVSQVYSHVYAPRQVSDDGRIVYAVVTLDLDPDRSPEALEPVQSAIREVPGLRVHLAGGPAFYGDIQAVSERDLQRSEIISLPLAALALLLVFGSVVAAGVPIVVGGAAVVTALAVIFLVASVTPMSIFVLNLATLLGLGLGVDYALLLATRFREELAARHVGRPDDRGAERDRIEEALAVTVATAGRAVFFSGITVLLGLIALVLFDFMVLRSVGLAGAIVVGLAMAAAVTLLPAVLAILGPRIDALSVRRLTRRDTPRTDHAGGWASLARWVMARPLRVFVPTLGLLLVLGSPFLHVRLNAPDATILPQTVPSRQAYDLLVSTFGEGDFAPLQLAVRTEGAATEPRNVGVLYDYSRRLASDPRITRVEGIVDVDPRLSREQYQLLLSNPNGPADRFIADALRLTTRGDLTTFTVYTPYGPNRSEARAVVEDIRDATGPLAPPAGVEVLVAGGAAEVKDVVDGIVAQFPRSALFIVIATYVVLFVLLRSVVLPAKALVMNALSITASFGALVWIFQDGNLSALLGFQPLGFVETTLPVILFCVLFGLSMDYEVFLLSRMKEVYDATGDNRDAVARGLERSGRIVSSAALIVVVVAGSFAFADIVLIKALGIGVALAVALDATVVRALLVPSTMRLLGDWNWWLPRRLARWIGSRLPIAEGATLILAAALLVAGCGPGGAILANEPAPRPVVLDREPATAPPAQDPQPITLPRDEAPHERLTEWWYYTGHLRADDGRRFGFEFVIFRAERGVFPVSWASHLALTDERGGRFLHEERTQIGPAVDRGRAEGFDLAIAGGDAFTRPGAGGELADPMVPGSPSAGGNAEPWRMSGLLGNDRLEAQASAFSINLSLDAVHDTPALHDRDGWVSFGPAGGSYYYSWTRMTADGELVVDGERLRVTGLAWFDHQWGDFIAVGGGGWDWFAVNLEDGTDLTLSLVRERDGSYPLVYGTLVRPDGSFEHLPAEAFSVTVTDEWTSPRTGGQYPAGWRIDLPREGLAIQLEPTVADQELDTRSSTGVVYWEGSQRVTATRGGRPLRGEAYVELTGYAAMEGAP